MTCFIVSNRSWHKQYSDEIECRTGAEIVYIDDRRDLTLELLDQRQPSFIFFPHWSYLIPETIYSQYECVIFHMTDLPFGRGGSPLQNLIVRGIYETKLSAIKCAGGVDAGDVYMKRDLSLYGSAEEIYMRAAELEKEMMIEIIKHHPAPHKQIGEVVRFKRRTAEESNIEDLRSLKQIFDHIRMLDADGYPKAFIETEYLRLEFERASLKDGRIIADVEIRVKEKVKENEP